VRGKGWLVCAAALLTARCNPSADRADVRKHFVDMIDADAEGLGRLDGGVLSSRGGFEVRDVGVHGDRRPALTLETPARVAFRTEAVESPFFRFALAVRPADAKVTIKLSVNDETVFEAPWREERGWVERRANLDRFAGKEMSIELSFEGDEASVMLAHPEILGRSPVRRPNVIVYVVDCLRADHVGAYGYPLDTTPNLDKLAADGVVLENLTTCAPWTKPSTACLFTSLLPTFHQARTVDDALARDRTTLAEVFQRAGYETAAWVANPVIDPRVFFFNQGFDRWADLRSFEERARRENIHDIETDAAEITQGVLPWLEEHRNETFFLYLHSLDLHFGYRPRPPFDAKFVSKDSTGLERDRELYDNELAYNDAEIGKLVSELKRLGLYNDTVLFVTADHGEEFGEHGANATRHGKTLDQEALHIPGILKLPGSRYAGLKPEALASNIDTAPTLLALAGVDAPKEFQGRSLVDVIEKNVTRTDRKVFSEVMAPNFVSYAVRDQRFKYVKTLVPELSESLYDLETDPGETNNLLPNAPAEGARLVAELDTFIQLGQHGFHLSVTGERPGDAMRVTLSTDAEISSAIRFSIATGDLFEQSPDKKRVTLTFTADGKPRQLVVQTTPPASEVRLEALENGRPLSPDAIRLGASGTHPAGVRVVLTASGLEVPATAAESLLQDDEDHPASVRAWYVDVGSGRQRVNLDEETTRILRSLGYIQ
jgi:arylsulfatase A-like enzyme